MIEPLAFFLPYFAQAVSAAPEPPPIWAQFVPFLLIIAVFYFLLIRPQMKMKKEQETLVNSAKTGDKIITTGGILGTITNVKEKTVLVKIADNVKIELLKTNIISVTKPNAKGKQEPSSNSSPSKKPETAPPRKKGIFSASNPAT